MGPSVQPGGFSKTIHGRHNGGPGPERTSQPLVKRHNILMLGLLRAADACAAAGAWAAAYGLHLLGAHWGKLHPPAYDWAHTAPWAVVSLLLALIVFGRLGLYAPRRAKSARSEAVGVGGAVILAWLLTYLLADYAGLHRASRAMMGLLLVNWLLLAVASRVLTRMLLRALRRRGWNLRHAAIVGTGRLAQRLFHVLRQNSWTGIEVSYFVGNGCRDDVRRPPQLAECPYGHTMNGLHGREVLGPAGRIDELVQRHSVDIVFVALPRDRQEQADEILSRLATTNVDVRVVPDVLSSQFLRRDVAQLEDLAVISLTHSPQHGWNSLSKRLLDLLGAAVLLTALLGPMLAIAIAVQLTSRGPLLYRQRRASLGGREFTMLKFRTMRAGAEVGTGPVWASDRDERVTPLGRLLRATSLDELPQLLNVLAGHMSLVGPRPERPELIERFRKRIPRYMLRSQVKAGLTGWAQVHGLRGNTSLRKRIQYDLYYITHWSLALDVWILVLSLWAVIPRRHCPPRWKLEKAIEEKTQSLELRVHGEPSTGRKASARNAQDPAIAFAGAPDARITRTPDRGY